MKRIRVPVLSLSMGKRRFRVLPGVLLASLKGADAIEYGCIRVGAKPLRELVSCIQDLGTLEVKANGRLEVRNIPWKGKGPRHFFAIESGAWLPEEFSPNWKPCMARRRMGQRPKPPATLVVLVPKQREVPHASQA